MQNQQSAISNQQSTFSNPRSAFTLVELLVTVSIIAILASILLGALYAAQDQARAMKTKSTIAKLNTIMMARWESYKTRRVPISIPAGTRPDVAAMCRLTAIREIMRLELPDRSADIPIASTTSTSFTCKSGSFSTTITVPRPSLSYSYMRKWGTPASDDALHGAETLYLIVASSQDDDVAGIELFGESEIGDTDKDGRPEFLDAWGNPITWIRWPAGFASELQPLASASDPDRDPATGRNLKTNHDPFDPRHVDTTAYALYPLIFSPGPDGKYEINNEPDYTYVVNSTTGILNPYAASSPPPLIGGWNDQDSDGVNDSIDNIHNHLIGAR